MACILVIDDESMVRQLLDNILSRAGHQVLLAADGVEGGELFRQELPALVITDMSMPRRNGLETIQDIRSCDPDAGILAISGNSSPAGVDLSTLSHTFPGVRTLHKPFRRRELLEVVDALLGESRPPWKASVT